MVFKVGNKLASIGHRNRKARAHGEVVVEASTERVVPEHDRIDAKGAMPGPGKVTPGRSDHRVRKEARRKGVIMTLGLHNMLVAAFRDVGANYRQVAIRVGVTAMMARDAWLKGWPQIGLMPIQTLVIEEQNDARIKLRDLESQELAKKDHEARMEAERRYGALRQSVVDARAQEGRMVLGMRKNIIDAGEVTATSIAAGLVVAKRVKAMVDDPETVITPIDGVNMLAKIAASVSSLSQAGRHVQQMERELLGTGETEQPADVLNREDGDVDLDALVGEATHYAELLNRQKNRKLLMISGGKRSGPVERDANVIDAEGDLVDDEAAGS